MAADELKERPRYGRALVIGASFAGLWAARMLADHFERVTILERDRLPDHAAPRPGVPQDRHVHVLLQRGANIMGRLLPGIEAELLAEGAHKVDLIRDGRGKFRGHWLDRYDSGMVTYACSRVLLECVVRRRVAALPNVELLGGARVEGLTGVDGRVTGVSVKWKDRDEATAEQGAFIVDASGRTSHAAEWLDGLGYGRVQETVIDAQVGYAGRRYRMPNPAPDWLNMLVAQEAPHKRRGGLIYLEEHGVWMVMVSGLLGDYPPTDPEEFAAFADTVDPAFGAAVRSAEPIGDVFGYRRTENRMRHYEKLARWPDQFVVTGDAACSLNPIYGQGMSVAAMAAEALGAVLERSNGRLDGAARQFQARYPSIVAPAWLFATGADLEWLGRTNGRSPTERFASWYLAKLLDVIPYDREVHQAFIGVQNLVEPASALFRPGVVARVVRQMARQ